VNGPDVRTLLGYLWAATGRNPRVRVRDLFDPDDPLVADIEAALAQPAAIVVEPLTRGCIVHGRAPDEMERDGRCPECVSNEPPAGSS
jgi:hypothetical protein